MQRIKVHITTVSPIIIRSIGGDANTVNTNRFINGSAILGLFARQYITRNNLKKAAHTDETFRVWFLEGALTFTNAYFLNQKNGQVYFPAPFSLNKPKYPPFGEFEDRLFQRSNQEVTAVGDEFVRMENSMVERCEVKTRLNFHHTRNKKTGTTAEGQIFTYESIDPEQTFEGNILGDGDLLSRFLESFQGELNAYLGRSKHTQYGNVKVTLVSSQPESFFSEIESLKSGTLPIRDGQISLTLLSDLVLYDQHGFPTTDLNVLEKRLPVRIKEKSKLFVKTGTIARFVSVWRLPRPAEVCFKVGSCFLLEASEADQDKLLKLQREGIGERRHEGFGRIVFGWQQQTQKLIEIVEKPPEIASPAFLCPKIARDTIKASLKRFIEKQAELHALQQAQKFIDHRPPNKSLLGRLENLLRTSDPEEFRRLLTAPGKLRKTAKDQLKQCRSAGKTLLEFLSQLEVQLEDILDQESRERITNLLADISDEEDRQVSPENVDISTEIQQDDSQFFKQLYRRYLTTFFSMLRKRTPVRKGGQ